MRPLATAGETPRRSATSRFVTPRHTQTMRQRSARRCTLFGRLTPCSRRKAVCTVLAGQPKLYLSAAAVLGLEPLLMLE